jgi:hypothetical protein
MKILTTVLIVILMSSLCIAEQAITKERSRKPSLPMLEVLTDLVNLRNLAISQINSPIGRAIALVEIGRITWPVDKEEAKRTLREAYRFTLPSGKENEAQQSTAERGWTLREAVIKNEIRHRILEIVRVDKAFATELFGPQPDSWERRYSYETYGNLVAEAIMSGSTESATELVLSLQDVSPIAISGMGGVVNEIAINHRASADSLILQIVERLQHIETSRDLSVIVLGLSEMIEPNRFGRVSVPPPGPAVFRTYLHFMIDYFNRLAQSGPDALRRKRPYVIRARELSVRYAQDLVPQFMALERLSASDSEHAWTPDSTVSNQGALDDSAEGGAANEQKIISFIFRGEFSKARELIREIKDGTKRAELLEMAKEEEATRLAKKGELVNAEKLAGELAQPSSIVRVYAMIINKHISEGHTRELASGLISTALLRLSHNEPAAPLEEKGSSSAPSSSSAKVSYDPLLAMLNSLMNDMARADEGLGLQVMDAVVSAANRSKIDTSLGLTGLDYETLKKLSANNEERVRRAALALCDPLRQILTLVKTDEAKLERIAKSNVQTKANATPK